MRERFTVETTDDIVGVPKELSIVATNKCNLDCSFCGGRYHMSLDTVDVDTQAKQIKEMLDKYPTITRISWTGGEPLLASRRVKELIEELNSSYPQIEGHELFTNGLLFKKELLPFLLKFSSIYISIDGFAETERPLQKIVESAGYDFFEIIDQLPNIHVQTVLTRDRLADMRWHEDLYRLYDGLHHYKFKSYRMVFDNEMPKPLSPDHVMNFIYGYKYIEQRLEKLRHVCGYGTSASVTKLFDFRCENCNDIVVVQSDGTFNQLAKPAVVAQSGCGVLANIIGVEAYKYIQNYLKAGK